mmetsp:Transcript_25644/g.35700  ORF Transcript_25644/g.35700 Transcript_25644/m.35700 type:complete len:84 (-) Transcript_25644:126-377(-)
MGRRSGIQRQVLSLYRSFLKVSRSKPETQKKQWTETIRSAFKEGAKEKKTNFKKIEYLLRQGNKRLELIKDSSVKAVKVVSSS